MGERTGEFPSPLSFQKGMAMKRMICLLLSACMLLCLAACGENTEQPPETESIDTTENQDGDHSHEIRLLTPKKHCTPTTNGKMKPLLSRVKCVYLQFLNTCVYYVENISKNNYKTT